MLALVGLGPGDTGRKCEQRVGDIPAGAEVQRKKCLSIFQGIWRGRV